MQMGHTVQLKYITFEVSYLCVHLLHISELLALYYMSSVTVYPDLKTSCRKRWNDISGERADALPTKT
jgi:hypothetical protein